MTLIEAMGSGLPIVVTEVGGVPDMLDSGCAVLTKVDSKDIAAALERYYLDEALREKHGKAARERANAFSAEQMARKYIGIYTGKEEAEK